MFPPEKFQKMKYFVGILLLVSGGTFLYVATMHILPETFGFVGHHKVEVKSKCSQFTDLVVITLGMFSPYVLHQMADSD